MGWAVGNYKAMRQTHGFLVFEHQVLPSLQKMKVAMSTGQEKFASVGVAALVQHFISFTQPPAELGRYCKKEQENKSPLQHLLICRSKFILCFSVVESSEWKNSGAAGLAICPGPRFEGASLFLPQVSPFASNQTNKLFMSQLLSFKMGKLLLSPPGIPCPQISWQLLTVAIWDLEENCC